jgi:hypothetical protein
MIRSACVLMLSVVLAGASHASEARVDSRTESWASDRALLAIAENLRFKLARNAEPDLTAWAGLVNQTVVIGQRLNVFGDEPVTASRADGRYIAVVAGRGAVVGSDPDEVLGRLLYFLASRDEVTLRATPVGIAEQRLTDTLAYLVSELR